MTREEAIAYGNRVIKLGLNDETQAFCEMAIKALEQEPETDGDCISRKELLNAIDTWDKFGCDADTKLVPYKDHYVPYIHYDDVIKCIKGMPSAKPKEPKTGYWYIDERPESNRETICSNCEKSILKYHKLDFDYRPKYCPNCGARMSEVSE